MTVFAGFAKYFRFICRRERIKSLIWLAALVGSAIVFAAMFPNTMPDEASIQEMSNLLSGPAMSAIMGPAYGAASPTVAIIMATECLSWLSIAIVVMNIFFVNRHTRVDEELGRHELFRSLPVGRLTGAASTLANAALLNILIGFLVSLGLVVLNIPGTTTAGAFAYGFSLCAQGMLFASLILCAAQLFSTARSVTGGMFGLFGLFYILRALGDMQYSMGDAAKALSYISPLGLGLRTFPFYENNFAPIWILLSETVVFSLVALALCKGRDLGEGLIPARKGRAEAPRSLLSPFGLSWRLSKASILAWSIAAFAIGATYGSVFGQLSNMIEGSVALRQFFQALGGVGKTSDTYVFLLALIIAQVAVIPAVTTLMRIRSEEKRGRLEQIYSRSVSRSAMLFPYIAISFLQSAGFMLLSVLGFWLSSQSSGLVTFGGLCGAMFVHIPAIWVMTGAATLLIGFLPKGIGLIWVYYAYTFIVLDFGTLLNMPEWARRITPFGNVPKMPLQEFQLAPMLILALAAVVLCVGGLMTYRRRDIG